MTRDEGGGRGGKRVVIGILGQQQQQGGLYLGTVEAELVDPVVHPDRSLFLFWVFIWSNV